MPDLARVFVLTALVFSTACSVNSYTLGNEEQGKRQPSELYEGYTVTEALKELGPPARLSATPQGFVMAWEFWEIRQNTVGLSLRPVGIEFLSFDWGEARTKGDFMLMYFNDNRELSGAAYGQWDSELGGGQSLQPLFGVIDVVDVDDLLKPMPQHWWGGNSLSPLPVTLNADSQLDMGQNGIQQRGTASSAGQHTLQMH